MILLDFALSVGIYGRDVGIVIAFIEILCMIDGEHG